MPLYLPSDPSDVLGNSDKYPLGPPIKKAPTPTEKYAKTEREGVVVNKETGKMETQIPVPPAKMYHDCFLEDDSLAGVPTCE